MKKKTFVGWVWKGWEAKSGTSSLIKYFKIGGVEK